MRPSIDVKHLLRRAALKSISATGLARHLRGRCPGLGGILAFHRIYEPRSRYEFGSIPLSISPSNFRRAIAGLAESGYDFVSMSEVERRITGRAGEVRKFVCLTFDDGFADTYTHAFPICRSLGIPMVVYVATGLMNRSFPAWMFGLEALVATKGTVELRWNGVTECLPAATLAQKRRCYFSIASLLAASHPDRCRRICQELQARYRIPFDELTDRHTLSADMIREMHMSGLVEFGAHSVRHPNLRRLGLDEARREMVESRRDLERILGTRVRHFAYPFGGRDAAGAREFALCREAGYRTAVTTRRGHIVAEDRRQLHALPRFTLNGRYQDTAMLELFLSGLLPRPRYRPTPHWRPAELGGR